MAIINKKVSGTGLGITGILKKKGREVHFIQHHLCHAPGSFYVSPYKEAALLEYRWVWRMGNDLVRLR